MATLTRITEAPNPPRGSFVLQQFSVTLIHVKCIADEETVEATTVNSRKRTGLVRRLQACTSIHVSPVLQPLGKSCFLQR